MFKRIAVGVCFTNSFGGMLLTAHWIYSLIKKQTATFCCQLASLHYIENRLHPNHYLLRKGLTLIVVFLQITYMYKKIGHVRFVDVRFNFYQTGEETELKQRRVWFFCINVCVCIIYITGVWLILYVCVCALKKSGGLGLTDEYICTLKKINKMCYTCGCFKGIFSLTGVIFLLFSRHPCKFLALKVAMLQLCILLLQNRTNLML